MEYKKRIADKVLVSRLEAMGAVLIEGPKWCGKTTTAQQHAKSVLRMQDVDRREEYLATIATRPSNLLLGDVPRLIDEWQDAPVLWDAVRIKVDERGLPGQFILTGSNTVDKKKIIHSGTGRISRMEMFPMSLWESGESNGSVSLKHLFDFPNDEVEGVQEKFSVNDLIYAACRGGWPASLNVSGEKAQLQIAKNYLNSVSTEDISRVDDVVRNPKLALQILRSYARNISTLAKTTSILADVTASGNIDCTRVTFDSYVEALEKLFVIQDIDAWCPAIRSKTAIRRQNAENKKWCKSFLNKFKTFCDTFHSKKSKIECIGCTDRRYYLKGMEIKPVQNMDIDLLYNDDFQIVDENLRSFMQNDKNGLVILHGEQGTGKTSYIRHLISETDKHFVYLPLDMASCLSDPKMITFICDKLADAVIVIEDCEQLLVDRSDSYNCVNTGLVNILNMADGLLGDSLNLKFICTFNSDVRKIDKALLRKGRLVDKYEFGKLSKEKTAALMNKQYHLNGDYEPMTLAEIFNYNIENHGQNRTRKSVGFN